MTDTIPTHRAGGIDRKATGAGVRGRRPWPDDGTGDDTGDGDGGDRR